MAVSSFCIERLRSDMLATFQEYQTIMPYDGTAFFVSYERRKSRRVQISTNSANGHEYYSFIRGCIFYLNIVELSSTPPSSEPGIWPSVKFSSRTLRHCIRIWHNSWCFFRLRGPSKVCHTVVTVCRPNLRYWNT